MQPEKTMTDTERKLIAQIAERKAANSRGRSAATIARLNKELATTREALEVANAARILLLKELDGMRKQIEELEYGVKPVTKATNQAKETRLSW